MRNILKNFCKPKVPLKVFSDDFMKKLESYGFRIQDLGTKTINGAPLYPDCNWWLIKYKFLELSLYYDPSDKLGIVGQPYYELYDGFETYRFLSNPDQSSELLELLLQIKSKHDKEVQEFPEHFL